MTQLSFREQAVAGGLHAHSVGSAYPFHPVYIANGDSGHWEVHNLMTGEKLYHWLNDGAPLKSDADYAGTVASMAAFGELNPAYYSFH